MFLPEGSEAPCAAPPHSTKGEQHAQGSQLLPKDGQALQASSSPGRREGLSMSTGQELSPLWAVLGAVQGRNRQRNAGLGFIFI